MFSFLLAVVGLMLFAGVASRGWYEALLHSGLLVAICYVIFAVVWVI